MDGRIKLCAAVAFILILQVTIGTGSYVHQTSTGYQDVVVVIEENSALTDCAGALERVKVSHCAIFPPTCCLPPLSRISIGYYIFSCINEVSSKSTGMGQFFFKFNFHFRLFVD